MNNLLDRFISQVDTLIPFLALSRPEVLEILQGNQETWFSSEQIENVPTSYGTYRTQISHSAFLLGYSYFEAFLADLVRHIYAQHPQMLPKEKEIKFSDVLECGNYDTVVSHMIEREVLSVFFSSMEKIIEYLNRKLNLSWPDDFRDHAIEASLLRNCLLHNNSCADVRLSKYGKWGTGEEIVMTDYDVHNFGIAVRLVAPEIYHQAECKYFNSI